MVKTLDPFTRTVAIFKAYYGIPRDLQDMGRKLLLPCTRSLYLY